MLDIKEVKKIVQEDLSSKYDFFYNVYLENILIGNAGIKISSDNMLYIYIKEEYQGNNFGKETFEFLIEKIKSMSKNKVLIQVNNDNIQMLRIINHYKYKIVYSANDIKCYEIGLSY